MRRVTSVALVYKCHACGITIDRPVFRPYEEPNPGPCASAHCPVCFDPIPTWKEVIEDADDDAGTERTRLSRSADGKRRAS